MNAALMALMIAGLKCGPVTNEQARIWSKAELVEGVSAICWIIQQGRATINTLINTMHIIQLYDGLNRNERALFNCMLQEKINDRAAALN